MDIINRLRAMKELAASDVDPEYNYVLGKAADEIARLRADNERLQSENARLQRELETERERCAIIAEQFGKDLRGRGHVCCWTRDGIAAAIRTQNGDDITALAPFPQR